MDDDSSDDLIGDALPGHDVTCMACGCLCDDLQFEQAMDGPRWQDNGCERARQWIAQAQQQLAADEDAWCWVDDEPVPKGLALGKAAELLSSGRRPAIVLGGGLTAEAYQLAARIGQSLDAVMCIDDAESALVFHRAASAVGQVGCTWGEVRQRADLVIFWQCDVLAEKGPHAWPRFGDRLGLTDPEQPIPRGRQNRSLWSISNKLDTTSQRCDHGLTLRDQSDLPALMTLRALHANRWVDSNLVFQQTGVGLDDWRSLYDAITSSASTALLMRLPHASPQLQQLIAEQVSLLSQELNMKCSFGIVPLPSVYTPNCAGAASMLGAVTGVSDDVDLSHRSTGCSTEPACYSLEALMKRDEADRVLFVGRFDDRFGEPAFARFLHGRPSVVISEKIFSQPPRPHIALTHTTTGMVEVGTVFRDDDLPLFLRPAFSSDRPTAYDLLTQLLETLSVNDEPSVLELDLDDTVL